jgi:hypothetical protein
VNAAKTLTKEPLFGVPAARIDFAAPASAELSVMLCEARTKESALHLVASFLATIAFQSQLLICKSVHPI